MTLSLIICISEWNWAVNTCLSQVYPELRYTVHATLQTDIAGTEPVQSTQTPTEKGGCVVTTNGSLPQVGGGEERKRGDLCRAHVFHAACRQTLL